MDPFDFTSNFYKRPDKKPDKKLPKFTLDTMQDNSFNFSYKRPENQPDKNMNLINTPSIDSIQPRVSSFGHSNIYTAPLVDQNDFQDTSFYQHERNQKAGLYTEEQNQTVEEMRVAEQGYLAKRMTKKSSARVANEKAFFDADPYLKEANVIRSDLGLSPIEGRTRVRRSSKKHGTRYAFDTGTFDKLGKQKERVTPVDYLVDFYRKEDVVNWGKGHGLKVDENDKGTFRTGSYIKDNYWTHNNRRRFTGRSVVQTYGQKKPENESEKTVFLYDKFMGGLGEKTSRYKTYYNPIDGEAVAELKKATDEYDTQKKHYDKYAHGAQSKYSGKSQIGPVAYAKKQENLKRELEKTNLLEQKKIRKQQELDNLNLEYYAATDQTFDNFEQYKQGMISNIDQRTTNQEYIIDTLDLDSEAFERKDRKDYLIPTLEDVRKNIDKKDVVLKKGIRGHDWQKKISQDNFGTDTIQGDSHVSAVLAKGGGKIRSGAYYSQDVGKLVRDTKKYESDMKLEIKQKDVDISNITISEDDSLAGYYSDTHDKEHEKASREYLSKSLVLTEEERLELEHARRQQAMGSDMPSQRRNVTQSRGRPSLKSVSKRQYKSKRTRGGMSTFGGLVI